MKNPIGFTEENVSAFTDCLAAIKPTTRAMAIRNLFALGCYLRLTGHRDAGTKMCICALDALCLPEDIYKKLLQGLVDDHDHFLAGAFQPHHEVHELLHTLKNPTP